LRVAKQVGDCRALVIDHLAVGNFRDHLNVFRRLDFGQQINDAVRIPVAEPELPGHGAALGEWIPFVAGDLYPFLALPGQQTVELELGQLREASAGIGFQIGDQRSRFAGPLRLVPQRQFLCEKPVEFLLRTLAHLGGRDEIEIFLERGAFPGDLLALRATAHRQADSLENVLDPGFRGHHFPEQVFGI